MAGPLPVVPGTNKVLTNAAPLVTTKGANPIYKPAPTSTVPIDLDNQGLAALQSSGPVQGPQIPPAAAADPNAIYNSLLASLAQEGYTPASSSGGGSSVVQTGPTLQQILSMTGLSSGYQAPSAASLQAQALNNTNLQLSPQLANIQSQIDLTNKQYQQAVTAAQANGQQQSADATKNYSDLAAFLQAAQQQGDTGFGQAATAQSGDYANLLSGLQQNYSNGKQAVTSEQQRLGLTGINNSAFDRDAAFLQGLAQNNQTAAANALSGQKANYDSTQGQLASGDAAGGVQEQNQLRTQLASILGGLQNTNQNTIGGLNSQMTNLANTKPALEAQQLATLEQTAQGNQKDYMDELIAAINAAASGQKVVSNGSSSTAASGITPQQQLTDSLSILSGERSNTMDNATLANQKVSQQLAQQNASNSTTNSLANLLINGNKAIGNGVISDPSTLAAQLNATLGSNIFTSPTGKKSK